MFSESFSVIVLLKLTPVCEEGNMVKCRPPVGLWEEQAQSRHIVQISSNLGIATISTDVNNMKSAGKREVAFQIKRARNE
jgi:hypothetical protein